MKLSRVLLAIMLSSLLQATYALDSTYMRNGEAYLAVSGLKASGSSTSDDGIYRLNDPQGSGLYLGKVVSGITQLHTFSVDLYRKIYTMSEPDEVNVSDSWTIKRQVVDGTEIVMPNSTVESGSLTGKKRVDIINWTGGGSNVTADIVDYGCHSYTHNDYRWKRQNRPYFYKNPSASPIDPYGNYNWYDGYSSSPYSKQYEYPNRRCVGDTQGDTLYRFENGTGIGTRGNGERTEIRTLGSDGIVRIYAREGSYPIAQGTATTLLDDPQDYMPCATSTNAVYLPVYQGKSWYEIPNGSWYSSWRARSGCQNNPGLPSSLTTRNFFYQVYCDYCDVLEKNWRLVTYGSSQANFKDYSQIGSGDDFGKTTTEQWARAVLAGCLDGCGGSSGNASIEGSRYIFDVTFMPDNSASGSVTVFSYNRREDADKGKVCSSASTTVKLYDVGGISTKVLTPAGVSNLGRADTKWIGVSKGQTNDYLYMLGTNQIRDWLTTASASYMPSGATIDAVTVSNQWNEKGGIIFAFDKTNGRIYKFTLDDDGNPNVMPRIDVATIQNLMKSDGDIDDIATDGFGNVYLSATYPSNSTANVPARLGWTCDDATSVSIAPQDDHVDLTFYFNVDFRKTVRKVSATGEDLSEVGSRYVTTRNYSSMATVDNASYTPELASTLSDYNSSGNFNGISSKLAELGITEGPIQLVLTGDISDVDITGSSKLAVINSPTPPEVKSLANSGESYLDICGPYDEYILPGPVDELGRMPLNQRPGKSNPVSTNEVNYLMVENYPMYRYQRNPNVEEDTNDESVWNPDGDYRRSGFINTIVENAETGKLSIDYNWGVYRIRDFEPFLNPNGDYASGPAKLVSRSNGNFAVLYAPNPGNYIVTCSAKYRFINYNTVNFGETITAWTTRTGGGIASKTAYAAGVVPGPNPLHNEIATADVVLEVRNYAAQAYSVTTSDPIVEYILNYIDSKEYEATGLHLSGNQIAVQYIVATNTGPIPEFIGDIAKIERHNVNPASGTHSNISGLDATNETIDGYSWGPTSSEGMTPAQGFHGLQEGKEYYWRIAPASQSVFLADTISLNDSVYNSIADRLLDPTDTVYYVQTPSFRFIRGESNISWKTDVDGNPEPIRVTATLYDADHNVVKSWNDLSMMESYKNASGQELYKYIKLGGDLVISDPNEYTLDISFSRFFMYDMFVYNATDDIRIDNDPQPLPKKLEVKASTKLMVMDTSTSTVEISATKIATDSVTFEEVKTNGSIVFVGETGKQLVGKINFQISDTNRNEAIATQSHTLWNANNYYYNQANLDTKDPTVNLKPTFKPNSGYVRILYSIPGETSDTNKEVLNNYYSLSETDTFCGAQNSSGSIATISELTSSTWNNSGNLKRIGKESKNGKSYYTFEYDLTAANHTMPFSYANNSPGYTDGIKFKVEARDFSGNVMSPTYLPCVADIVDTIRPIPYVRIKEFKDNKSVVLPKIVKGGTAIATDTSHYSSELKFGVSGSGVIASETVLTNTVGGYSVYVPQYDGYSINEIASASYANYQVPGENINVEDGVQVYIRAGAMDNSGATKVTSFKFKYVDADGTESDYTYNQTQIATITVSPRVGQSAIFHEHATKNFTYGAPIEVEAIDNAREHNWYPYTVNNNVVSWGEPVEKGAKSNSATIKITLPIHGTKTSIRTIEKYTKPKEH